MHPDLCNLVKKNIDPIFGTTLAPKYRALYDQVCDNNQDVVHLCKAFRSHPSKNPLTNRSIKEDSYIYGFFTMLANQVLRKKETIIDNDDAKLEEFNKNMIEMQRMFNEKIVDLESKHSAKLEELSKKLKSLDAVSEVTSHRQKKFKEENATLLQKMADLEAKILKKPKEETPPLQTIEMLKKFYINLLSDPSKNINRAFLLLNFHPDKLPQEIREKISADLASGDTSSSLYSSRVFSTINTKSTLTIAELKAVLNETKYNGGRRRK
jgi:Skp family chaperone for outer membrane proteins